LRGPVRLPFFGESLFIIWALQTSFGEPAIWSRGGDALSEEKVNFLLGICVLDAF